MSISFCSGHAILFLVSHFDVLLQSHLICCSFPTYCILYEYAAWGQTQGELAYFAYFSEITAFRFTDYLWPVCSAASNLATLDWTCSYPVLISLLSLLSSFLWIIWGAAIGWGVGQSEAIFVECASEFVLWFLPEGCVSGKVRATNLSKAPRSCKSCVTVSLLMIILQIFVHVWCWSLFRLMLSLPSPFSPWMARSKSGNSFERCYSGQLSYRSSKRVRMSWSYRMPSRTHWVANLKKLDKLSSATEALAAFRSLSLSRRIMRSLRLTTCVKLSEVALVGPFSTASSLSYSLIYDCIWRSLAISSADFLAS